MIDAHIHHGNALGIDLDNITWRRAIDMNDRALRNITCRPRRADERPAPRDRLRHHRRLGGHGDHRGRARPGRPARTAGHDHHRLLTFDGKPVTAERPQRRRRDGRPAQGRAASPTCADARGPAVPRCTPARSRTSPAATTRLVADRIGMKPRRLRRHGVGLRLRHGHGEVLRHRLPLRRADAERGRARLHGPGDQAPRRRRRRRLAERLRQPAPPPADDQEVRAARAWWPSTAARATATTSVEAVRELALDASARTAPRSTRASSEGGEGAAKLAEAVVAACDAPSDFKLLTPTRHRSRTRSGGRQARSTAPAT